MTTAGPGRGTNSVNLRLYNERSLLQRLRRAGEASKADLARWAQLTNTAVGSIVQSLEESRLIEPAGRRQEGQRGQPAGLYRINPEGAYGIGVRLDRTSIETVMIDLGGQHPGARRARPAAAPPRQGARAGAQGRAAHDRPCSTAPSAAASWASAWPSPTTSAAGCASST